MYFWDVNWIDMIQRVFCNCWTAHGRAENIVAGFD
jgi:hypothetical protein